MTTAQPHKVDVCIVGAGPAGILLGLLLAKQGIKVLVLEQQKDFEHPLRGEIIMPRVSQLLSQLGLQTFLDELPHQKVESIEFVNNDEVISELEIMDLCSQNFLGQGFLGLWTAQPAFLGGLYRRAHSFENFELWFNSTAQKLIKSEQGVKGVVVKRDNEIIKVQAKVTVGADGRNSKMRKLGEFRVGKNLSNTDIIWFKMTRPSGYGNNVRYYLTSSANFFLLPKYSDDVQVGMFVPRGEFDNIREQGLQRMQEILLTSSNLFKEFVKDLMDFEPFEVLPERITTLKKWSKNGLLMIGDAAHTCSPVGPVGMSMALYTAAMSADIIASAVRRGEATEERLGQVQKQCEKEIQKIQKIQQRISQAILATSPLGLTMAPHYIKLFGSIGMLKGMFRELYYVKKPYPLDPSLSLESGRGIVREIERE